MESLVKSKPNVSLRRINVGGRQTRSEVASQYRITSIPALWLYKGSQRISTSTRDVWKRIEEL